MIGAIQTALGGLAAASQRAGAAAERIASPAGLDTLAGDSVDLSIARASYKANAAVIRTAGEMQDDLLHIFDKTV